MTVLRVRMDKKYPMVVSVWINNIQALSVFCRLPTVFHNIKNHHKRSPGSGFKGLSLRLVYLKNGAES